MAADTTTKAKGTAGLAEDGDLLLAEALRWLDSLDVVALDALAGGASYSPIEALEFVLCGHGRIRRNLGAAVAA